jgi:CDP-4-dehydro-6-deoxyglucose reductase
MAIDDVLRMKGPFGEFSLNENSSKPILFVATGTGFAPIQSLIDQLIDEGSRRSIALYWGGRTRDDLYFRRRIEQWQFTTIDFSFIPLLSRPAHGTWAGRTGHVGAAIQQDISDFSPYDVYACGAPAMVDDVFRRMTVEGSLPESAFHADSFYCAAPTLS